MTYHNIKISKKFKCCATILLSCFCLTSCFRLFDSDKDRIIAKWFCVCEY